MKLLNADRRLKNSDSHFDLKRRLSDSPSSHYPWSFMRHIWIFDALDEGRFHQVSADSKPSTE
jgi:hypothetical protein